MNKTHEKGIVIIEVRHEIQVSLPEGIKIIDADGTLSEECRERATDAAISAIPQHIYVYIDGQDKDPASVYIELTDSEIEEIRGESEE